MTAPTVYQELWDDFERNYQDGLIRQSGERRHTDELIQAAVHSGASPEQVERRVHEVVRSHDNRSKR